MGDVAVNGLRGLLQDTARAQIGRQAYKRAGTPREWAGRAKPVAAADIHMTLRFIGDVDMPSLDTLRGALALDFDAFDLELGRPQLWDEVAVLRPSAIRFLPQS